jgi:hypothetical protein
MRFEYALDFEKYSLKECVNLHLRHYRIFTQSRIFMQCGTKFT